MDINELKPFDRIFVHQSNPKFNKWHSRVCIVDSVDYLTNTIIACWGGEFIQCSPDDIEKYVEKEIKYGHN